MKPLLNLYIQFKNTLGDRHLLLATLAFGFLVLLPAAQAISSASDSSELQIKRRRPPAIGPTGPTGPAGSPGATGATGTTGADGANGIQGLQGIPGAIGTAGPNGDTGSPGATG